MCFPSLCFDLDVLLSLAGISYQLIDFKQRSVFEIKEYNLLGQMLEKVNKE